MPASPWKNQVRVVSRCGFEHDARRRARCARSERAGQQQGDGRRGGERGRVAWERIGEASRIVASANAWSLASARAWRATMRIAARTACSCATMTKPAVDRLLRGAHATRSCWRHRSAVAAQTRNRSTPPVTLDPVIVTATRHEAQRSSTCRRRSTSSTARAIRDGPAGDQPVRDAGARPGLFAPTARTTRRTCRSARAASARARLSACAACGSTRTASR